MADEPGTVEHHFASAHQQLEARRLGMWTFLATEILLFGGLFMAIAVYRVTHPEAMREASEHLYKLIGGANTAVLLTSSLTMAIAVAAAREGARRTCLAALAATAALGTAFLTIKAYEYGLEYTEGLVPGAGGPFPLAIPGAEMFFNLYFVSTGLHAFHLAAGICLVGATALRLAVSRLTIPRDAASLEMAGLYWHLVDAIWIFLYPVLYLVG